MKIKPSGFSPNGKGELRGTLVVLSNDGTPSGFEQYANYSDVKVRQNFVKELSSQFSVPEDEARKAMTEVMKSVRAKVLQAEKKSQSESPLKHSRPVIVTSKRYLREIVDQSWHLIAAANNKRPRFFRFGNTLTDLTPSGGRLRPRILTHVPLRGHLDRQGDFVRLTKGGLQRPDRPPRDVVDDMLAWAEPPVPQLKAVATSPIFAPDGSLIAEDGYHQGTGLFLDLGNLTVPPVPKEPSVKEMACARSLLLGELFGDFPFARDSDRAHVIAALITLVVREMIKGPTPLFLVESPVPGTGKGLLAGVLGLVATGEEPSIMTEAHDEEEWRKRVTARLAAAPRIILIDNIRRRLDSSALAAALTATTWEDRYLGVSKTISVPVTAVWMATANNPALSNEMARRIVRIRLDADVERPWERSAFKHADLLGWVRDTRGELLGALFSLVKSWLAAGGARGAETMGSYESWAAIVGGILNATGIGGFLEDRDEVYVQSELELEGWKALVDYWRDKYGDQKVGVGLLFELAKDRQLLTELRTGRGDQGARTAMGIRLSRLRDRRISGWWVRYAGRDENGSALYRLQDAAGSAEVTEGPEGPGAPVPKGEAPPGPSGPGGTFAAVFPDAYPDQSTPQKPAVVDEGDSDELF